MEIVEPHPSDVVHLFRALHTYHAELAPTEYHCDAPDSAFAEILEKAVSAGGRIFAHDAGWGLVSYVLIKPEVTARDALRLEKRIIRVDHAYVSPAARGHGLGRGLIARVEQWMREAAFEDWYVIYHSDNPGAAEFYASLGSSHVKGINRKRIV